MSAYECPNTYYVGQSTKETCWRAAYEMLLRYKGMDPKLADNLPNNSDMRTRGILDSEFAGCAKALGLGGIRYTYFKAIENLDWALRTCGPIWVSGFYCDGYKHIVCVKGVDVDDAKVLVNDPWRTFTGAKAKTVEWSFSYFANNLNPVPWACQLWY
jgi:hypothetical protein